MMSDFMSELKKESDLAQDNVSVTENGAIGYKTSGKALLDLNFRLSSMRNMRDDEIWDEFLQAYNENPVLSLIWMFFARDAREGMGERRTFRVIFKRLCRENESAAIKLLTLIPFYGRWDDVVEVFCADVPAKVRDAAFRVINDQLRSDLDHMTDNKPVSLLAKWLPSENTSSKDTRHRAEMLRNALGWTPKLYRQTLSRLRHHIDVVEQKMSANEWSEINYEAVPSRAAMNYRNAFTIHDSERYEQYLTNVKEGKAKIHAGVLYPYDIVHAYDHPYRMFDDTLEVQWNALPNTVREGSSTLVVVDGSGSMGCTVGNSSVTCHDVANSIGIYFAEKLTGPYHNQFITFSSSPKFVSFNGATSLRSKLDILHKHTECSNTNIEKVFDLVLSVAVKYHLKQDEIPSNILIISDMEFDAATYQYNYWNKESHKCNAALFDTIKERWEKAGYQLPRLVFWNVCSRTGTIPLTTNELGVALVSGFSPNIADMVLSGSLDPYQCLLDKLLSGRYLEVEAALRE